jgi:hypothetical protein
LSLATPFNFNPDEGGEGIPAEIPYHTACGLPVELCICPDAPIQARDGGFVDTKTEPAGPGD